MSFVDPNEHGSHGTRIGYTFLSIKVPSPPLLSGWMGVGLFVVVVVALLVATANWRRGEGFIKLVCS